MSRPEVEVEAVEADVEAVFEPESTADAVVITLTTQGLGGGSVQRRLES